MFLGTIRKKEIEEAITKAVESIKKKFFKAHNSSTYSLFHHLIVLFNGCLSKNFVEKDIENYIRDLCNNWNNKFKALDNLNEDRITQLIEDCTKATIELRKEYSLSQPRNPLILILDSKLNNFPFENLPLLRNTLQPISRMPTMEHLIFACNRFSSASKSINTDNAFFVLNPTKDLEKTQQTFESYFIKEMKWKGIVGKEPKEQEIFRALEESELFIYCGHGAGEGIYSSEELRKVEVRSSALLMGCSSSFFSDNGVYESNGITMAYLSSGSPLILGNLWDVTDRDIDRYLKSLLKLWLNDKNTIEGSTSNLLEAVVIARNNCKMKYLIGAAPVCYGIPIYYVNN